MGEKKKKKARGEVLRKLTINKLISAKKKKIKSLVLAYQGQSLVRTWLHARKHALVSGGL